MKLFQCLCICLISLGFSAEAKWSCFSKYDKMDDVRINGCSTDDLSGYRTFRGIPTLYVRTTNNELEVYLSAGEYVGNIEDIEIRFDSTSKETIGVGSSTDNVAMFIDESQTLDFVRKIMKYKKLLVRFTPLNENPRTLEFNLSGFNSKNSVKLIGVINQLISAENKKIEQAKKDEEDAKLQAKKDEEAAKLLAEQQQNNKAIDDKEFYKTIENMKNNGTLNGTNCEKFGGEWNWHGNINEWLCERKL